MPKKDKEKKTRPERQADELKQQWERTKESLEGTGLVQHLRLVCGKFDDKNLSKRPYIEFRVETVETKEERGDPRYERFESFIQTTLCQIHSQIMGIERENPFSSIPLYRLRLIPYEQADIFNHNDFSKRVLKTIGDAALIYAAKHH